MILDDLLASKDQILDNAKEIEGWLARYDWLRKSLPTTNVAEDRNYQRTFNGFYVVMLKSAGWYRVYYSILEREKCNDPVSFSEILIELWGRFDTVETSFVSKLVATINPEMPIYDANVRECLGLVAPSGKPKKERLLQAVKTYNDLKKKTYKLTQNVRFGELRGAFDETFPKFRHFTDIKKLDLFMWKSES